MTLPARPDQGVGRMRSYAKRLRVAAHRGPGVGSQWTTRSGCPDAQGHWCRAQEHES